MDAPAVQMKVDVLKMQMEALRKEVQNRIETDYTIWKITFGGIAAVIVLKSDINLRDYLPLAPLLAMALVVVAVTELFYIYQNGYSLARCEWQINGLLGDGELLTHELRLWKSRKQWLNKWGSTVAAGISAAAIIQWVLIYIYLAQSKFCTRDLGIPLYTVSMALPILAMITFQRARNLALNSADPPCGPAEHTAAAVSVTEAAESRYVSRPSP